ncbi:MAG: hypothetical protein ABI178_00850 [Rhodanobacter sp.]
MGNKSMGLLGIAVCVMFALPTLGHAAGTPWKTVDSEQAFHAQAVQVRKDLGQRGQYGGISFNDRTVVEADLDQIDALLRKHASAGKLSDSEQVALVNAQERINTVLTRNEGNRLVCRVEARTGTNFKEKVCRTQAEIDGVQRNTQQNSLMRGSGSGARGN